MNNATTIPSAFQAKRLRRGGFTLVELLVVIGIIAMLVGLLIVGINAAQKRAQKVNTQFLMSSISQALSKFKSDHGYYPPVLGDPSTLNQGTLWGNAVLSSTPSTQVGYMRDLLPPPTNAATVGQTTKVGQWSTAKAKALQDWNSVTTLAEYLLGAGDRSADGYGICGELSSPPPTDYKPGEREQPRAGIRSPGADGVWGAALQPILAADVAATPGAAGSYTGVTLGSPTRKGLFFTRNLALPSRVTIATATASGLGNDNSKCILRSRPNLEGKVYGPYIELKDPAILGGVKGVKANGDLDIVRATDGDDNFDRYPKVILDYWGQPIRYYRRGYVNFTPNTPDQATDGTSFDLGDFFALRPTKDRESEFVPDAQAKNDVLDDENPDLQVSAAIAGKDRSATPRLRAAEFALLSAGPDKKMDRTRRIALSGPNKDVDINADNIVETGPMNQGRTGFTLVELLVVIGIIALLASLVLAVSGGILANSERKQVDDTFTLLNQAIRELELTRGQELVFSRKPTASSPRELAFFDIEEDPTATKAYIMPKLLALLSANDRSREFINKINPDFLKQTGTGANVVLDLVDPWNNRISVIPCGRPATEREMRDAYRTVNGKKGNPVTADPLGIGIDRDDRTVRTNDEKSIGVCSGRRWCFLSNGPDGLFGSPPWSTTKSDQNKDGIDDWADNIFSQQLTQPVVSLP